MTTLAILFILIGLILYGIFEVYQIKLKIKPQKVPPSATQALYNILAAPADEDDPGGRILDLGSGFGTFVMSLAKLLPEWEIDGVEQNPTPWFISNMRSVGKQTGNFRFFLGDFTKWPLKNYDIIFVNQTEPVLKRWEASIGRRLPPGGIVVSLNTALPRIKPTNVITIDDTNKFFIYQRRPASERVVEDEVPATLKQPLSDVPPAPDLQPSLDLETPAPQPQPEPGAPPEQTASTAS